jgi:UDP-GlcNAc:undecaprenyl-phosphate GlcNAc-1-phosphate transferase
VSDPVRYTFAFVVPLIVTLTLTPVAGRIARRAGILDHPSTQKFHRESTPYLGGLALAVGLAIVGSVTAGASGQVAVILLGGFVLAVWGLLDDWMTLGPGVKLLIEAGAGVGLWLADVRGGLFGVEALDLLLTVAWVIVITNAVNLLDNMDGLAAGVSAAAALTFFGIAASRRDYLVGSFALAVAGASIGFLRHNLPPARIFLGDAGALMLGFLLAALGLKLDLVGEGGLVRSAIPALILGVPLFDTTLVVIDRLRGRRPISRGGTDHSSHRLASQGLSHGEVVAAIVGAQAICCATALALLDLPFDAAVAVIVAVAVAGIGLLVALLRIRPLTGEGEVRRSSFARTPAQQR